MEKCGTLILTMLMAFSLPGIAEEGPQVDFILLVDTSLSMAPAIEDLKQYVATGVVGRFVQQGDWVAVLAFYGKSTLIWEGDVLSEEDKAALIRSLHALEATGRFTDIGTALDDMKQLVIRRNRPEIPKYVLLLTDEVQEAPPGSSYRSDDFTVSHDMLEYVRKVDMGSFYAITIGYGLASRIESDLESLMKTLNDPPVRPERFLPGGSNIQNQDASTLGNTSSAIPGGSSSSAGEDLQAAGGKTAISGGAATGNQGGTAGIALEVVGDTGVSLYLILGLVMGIAILGSVLLLKQRSRSKKSHGSRRAPDDEDKDKPSKLKDGKL